MEREHSDAPSCQSVESVPESVDSTATVNIVGIPLSSLGVDGMEFSFDSAPQASSTPAQAPEPPASTSIPDAQVAEEDDLLA